ncbi:helix-turn-helix transcriptional regulator [Paenibacillus xanthanilyticus]|uniref:AraC family transcriptional regulator n=1 Tax=Paenibacillus xanthanilyticus TaxID=1783531 RepID=A0ABV8K115_9BACL
MTYPKELREHTRLDEKTHPVQFFFNRCPNAKDGQQILFLHWHEHFEIIVMQQGAGVFHIDSQPYEAVPGDVLIVPAGGLHVGYSSCEGDVAFLSIVFNSALFQHWVHDPIHAQYVLPFLEGRVHYPVKPSASNPDVMRHYGLLDQAAAEFASKEPGYLLIVKAQLHMLLTHLSRAFLPLQLPEFRARPFIHNRERFKALILDLETRYADKHSAADAARAMNMSLHHFCKMFKKLTGRTFIEYVHVCKVNEAERLLLESDLTMTEIAEQIGCDNPNYFTKLFKQYKGVAPSLLRKSNHSPK